MPSTPASEAKGLAVRGERTQARFFFCGSSSRTSRPSIWPLCTFQTGMTVGVVLGFSNCRVDSWPKAAVPSKSVAVISASGERFIKAIVVSLALDGKTRQKFA